MAKRTDEEKKAWKEGMANLAAKVRQMTEEEKEAIACKCGTLTAEGHPLSPYNTIFLWMQAGKALAQIGGFKQWQRIGRKVVKGQHAVGYIYVPMNGKKKEEEKSTEKAERMHFRLVPVFDVEQTEKVA